MHADRKARRVRSFSRVPWRRPQTALLAVALLLLAGCARPLEDRSEAARLRISGSTSMKPLLEDLAQAYETAHPSLQFEVRGGDSTMGVQELRAQETDIAAVSWNDENKPAPPGLRIVPIARDGLVIIVHPANKVPGLTLTELRALYRGEVLDWSTLGGPSAEPVLISREDGSGDRQAFESLVMGEDRVTLNALVMPTAAAVVEYVARHPSAVGYVSLAQVRDEVRALPIEEVIPTREQVKAGAYHLSRMLNLYVSSSPSTEVRSFLDFALGPAGQAIVARYYAPLR
jgi:phosphate transport system substrate-binding protein